MLCGNYILVIVKMKQGALYCIVISTLESHPYMQLDLPAIKPTEVVNLDKVLG